MSAASNRIQIPYSFSYPASPASPGLTTYGSSSATTYTGVPFDSVEPVVGVTVTLIDRDTNLPVNVYQREVGSTQYTTLITDAIGAVPGWVEPGSYTMTAPAQGAFAGAVIHFDAIRGDGVTRIAPGAVIQPSFALQSVGFPQLDAEVQGILNSLAGIYAEVAKALALAGANVPPGTVLYYPVPLAAFTLGILPTINTVYPAYPGPPVWFPAILPLPAGFIPAVGQVLAISEHPALYASLYFDMPHMMAMVASVYWFYPAIAPGYFVVMGQPIGSIGDEYILNIHGGGIGRYAGDYGGTDNFNYDAGGNFGQPSFFESMVALPVVQS